jgi:hypothetical protein
MGVKSIQKEKQGGLSEGVYSAQEQRLLVFSKLMSGE